MSPLLRMRVAARWQAAEGIDAFELAPADPAHTLPPYEAGAHVDVHLPNGHVRQYSLCGKPGIGNRYRIAVLKEEQGRGGSRCLHDTVAVDATLAISAPRRACRLQSRDGIKVLFAGGVGITPILAMAYELLGRGEPFELHYFARTRARAAFLDELLAPPLAQAASLHLDDESAPGAPPALDAALRALPADGELYACGPAGFLDRISGWWQREGLAPERFHFESFVPAAPSGDGAPFEVEVASSGLRVTVAPQETVVEALARCGVEVPVSCEQGICGTCLTGIKEGIPEHRDQYLTEQEHAANQCFTPCCSRARSPRLVLDL